MQDLPLIILGALLILVLMLMALLSILLFKSVNRSQNVVLSLLEHQTVENQSLRNQLRAESLNHLAGLNHETLPSSKQETLGSTPLDVADLGEAIAYEETLASEGYQTGDLGDLESAGWPRPIFKRDGDGIVAYDA